MASYPPQGEDPYYNDLASFLGVSISLTDGTLLNAAVLAAINSNLATYAPISNPTFTGVPSAPTPPQGDNSTRLATTQYVLTAVDLTTVTTQSGTTYTLANSDAGTEIEFSNAGAVTVTIPASTLPVGYTVNLRQEAAGQVTVVAAGGATVNSSNGLKTRVQYSTVGLIQRGTNSWILTGDSTT